MGNLGGWYAQADEEQAFSAQKGDRTASWTMLTPPPISPARCYG